MLIEARREAFVKELRAYLFIDDLTSYDLRKLREMFDKYATPDEVKIIDKTVYLKPETTYICRCISCNRAFLKDSKKPPISIEEIENIVSEYTTVSLDNIRSKSRKREYVEARGIIYLLAKKYLRMSLKSIGLRYSERDHTSVLHGISVIKDVMDTNANLRDDIRRMDRIVEDILNDRMEAVGKEYQMNEDDKEKFGTLQAVG